jgi:class 3 adenylate cyclase
MSVLFTATYPERVRALVLAGVYAKRVWSPDYPWAPTSEQRDREYAVLEREWAEEMDVGVLAPSATDDPLLMRRIATFFRHSASPGAAVGLLRMNTQIDTRAVLATIGVPTLVLQRTGDRDVNVEEGRWISQQIPGAKYVELPGEDHLVWVGDTDTMLDEVETFLPGARRGPEPNRVLATILFTDIVGSTERAAALGDRRWRELLEEHHRLVRAELDNFRGLEIDTAGDGFFARFDAPARAIRCAYALCAAVRELGLEIRAGVHTGECEIIDDTLAGIAIHVGARVAAHAAAGEVLVSHTVKDLVAGSGIDFVDRGEHQLKGVPGTLQLYEVTRI